MFLILNRYMLAKIRST